MRHYHGGPHSDHPNMEELAMYIPMVHEKIASNLECYLEELEKTHSAAQQGDTPDALGAGDPER